MSLVKKTVDEWLNDIDYNDDPTYVPSEFALEFVSFIKLVNGEKGEENKTPIIHYKMLDKIAGKKENTANMCARGLAKTTIFAEYLFLYIAVYGSIPGFGVVDYALYLSDSIENGVKKMRLRVERRCENSEFLKRYVTTTRFTDIRWYFKNAEGKEFVVTGHGAKTGVRGTVELNTRPQLAVLDDLLGDEDARSATIIENVENTVYSAIDYALHPNKRKIIWSGTPFNAKDPLYKAIESGVWHVNVYPVCEVFPCSRKEFKGAWEDRFSYDYVNNQYMKSKGAGQLDSFNQELMLRITSEEDRLIKDSDIIWYKRSNVLKNQGTLSKGRNSNTIGIRPTKDKMSRFQQNAVPLFKSKKIWLPEELKESEELVELLFELSLATLKGFKSKHDDQIDTITMLAELNAWKPSEVGPQDNDKDELEHSIMWGDDGSTKKAGDSSYFV